MSDHPQPPQKPIDPRRGPLAPTSAGKQVGGQRQPLRREGAPAPAKPVAAVPQPASARPARPRPVAPPIAAPLAPAVQDAAAAKAKPVAPPIAPLAPRLAPSTTPVVLPPTRSRSSAAALVSAAVAVLTVAAGGWWYVSHRPKTTEPVAVVAEEKAAPAPAAPTEAKVIAPLPPLIVDRPAETASIAAAAAPTPMPEATIASPEDPTKPKTAGPLSPDPFKDVLVLDGIAARSPVVQERWAKLLRTTLRENEWPKYLDLLQRSLEVELRKTMGFDSPQRYDRYTTNPFFMRAMFQRLLGQAAGDDARKLIASDERVRHHLTVVCENNELMESFLRAWTPADSFRNSMDTWATLATDDVDAYGKYRELAVACSLVYEKPKTVDWNGEHLKITAADRFLWYKKKDKAGQLIGKITEMNAWKLAWVVCAPVPESEMEWAIAELGRKFKQGTWGNTYEYVPYDMTKALTGKSKVPYDAYTFAEILKKGGICGDRAYFSSNTARSVGLPATALAGDGPRGGHAWFTWLVDEDKWAFSGRFDGYPSTTVHNPSNGARISEQKFVRMSDSHAPTEAKSMRAQRLMWLHDLQVAVGQQADADYALDFAVKASPHESDLWEQKIKAWRALVPPPAASVWKPYLDALKREFRDDTDMMAIARKAEDEFVLGKVDAAVAKTELRSDVRDLSKLKGLTSLEEIRSAYQRYAAIFTKENDYVSLRRIYREGLDDYGKEAAKFKGLAHDYWNVVKDAPAEVKTNACRDMEAVYERHVETKSGDYFDVKSQNSAAEVVADCWRKAGDVARAERIEKAVAKRGKKATKTATNAL